MEEAYDMALAALGLCITELLNERIALPKPSLPSDITITPDTVLFLLNFDLEEYRRKHNSKAVKKH